MDCEASKLELLQRMLSDEISEPTDLPISLLKTITKNFSDDVQIGSGGFAAVYKGFLRNGCTVAVKKLFDSIDLDESKYNQEFIMADVRQRLLCFEYLSDGSLQDYINDASHGLEWSERYKILKGICEGLCHLHEAHIVHLDLKPTNILLNDNMIPKISDFGLSRRFGENQTRTITSRLCGSLGYLAPELHDGVITFKSDIYSLGVIFTEILTGKRVYYPVHEVLQNWRKRFDKSSAETLLEQVRVCAEISTECRDLVPEKRPAIQHIIQRLVETERMDQLIISGTSTSLVAQVQDEVQPSGLMRSSSYTERQPETTTTMAAERPAWALVFRTSPRQPIFTGRYIEDEAGRPLEIILVDADSGLPATTTPQPLRLELVPLFADFPPDGRADWSAAEFQQGIVKGRQGKQPLLTGDVGVAMRGGRAVVPELRFSDDSSWVRGQKLRIGVRVMPGSGYGGARILEGVTEAFVVRDSYTEVPFRFFGQPPRSQDTFPRDLEESWTYWALPIPDIEIE